MKSKFAECFYNDTVEVVEIKETGAYNKQTTQTTLAAVKADIQPYSGNLALEMYGYNIECEKRMYYDTCADVKIGNYILCNDVLYRIVYTTERTMGGTALLKRC